MRSRQLAAGPLRLTSAMSELRGLRRRGSAQRARSSSRWGRFGKAPTSTWSNHQATIPRRSWNVPVGPSFPMVASFTMASVPCSTVCGPEL